MQDELDSLIDGGLAAYGDVEPLAGLEERVLGRVRSRGARRWWWMAVPVALAATMAAVMLRPRTPEVAPPVVALAKPPAPVLMAPTPAAKRVVRRAAKATDLPKREVFPTIALLTREERLLLRMAESHPEDLARPVVPEGEIEIKPIEIAPLTIDGGQ